MRRFAHLVLALILMVGVSGLTPPAHAATDDTRVLPQLQNDAEANPNKTFRVIVQRINGNKDADGAVPPNGGTKIKDMAGDAFIANVPAKALAALGKNPAVKFVTYDAPMIKTGTVDVSKLATLYPQAVKASGLWSGTSPVTGAGIGVAVIDTGITNRPDFNNSGTAGSRIVAKALFNANLEKTNDGNGHGTHVAGIIAGNSWNRSETALRGKYIGVAPEAKLINVRVSDETGMSYVSDVVNAIDWVIQNRTTYNIRVMNLSLVSSVAESATTSILAAAVEKAWFNGIFVVVSAGNNGVNTMFYPPANDPFVVTVGAADPLGTVSATDDGMASWSSYGVTQDGVSKPDVVAPGRYIVAPLASSDSTLGKQFPDRIVDSYYLQLSGTSMAAPVVSGIAALAFQAHPEWTNDQVKWLLMNTAIKLGGATPLPGQGAGEANAEAVVRFSGSPVYANQGLTINIQLTTTDGSVTYNSANWSSANWSSANWSSANWSSANWSSANWSSANWSSANWSSATESSVQ